MASELESSFLDTTLSSDEYKSCKGSQVSRIALERRQLLHSVELLKLSVTVKDNQLKELRDSHALQIEELEEKLADSLHHRQVMHARMEFSAQSQADEKAQYEQRLASMEKSRRELQDSCSTFQKQTAGVMTVCDKPLLSAVEFQTLKSRRVERLLPCDLLQVALYESILPTLREKEQLSRDVAIAQQEAAEHQEEANRFATMHQKEAEQRHKVHMLCTDLQEQLEKHVLAKMSGEKERDMRILNYDDVLKERDTATQRCQSLQSEVDQFELRVGEAVADISDLTAKLSAAERHMELLQQDKAYLTQQVDASKHHQHLAEDRLSEIRQQLQTSTKALESLQLATTNEREERRKEWNERLAHELGDLKAQTGDEIQRIRSQSAEAVQREARLLKEALERCQLERDNATCALQDVEAKHQTLLLEFQKLESTGHNQLAECQHELQLRVFELERLRLLHTDCASKEESAKLDAMKLSKQLELVKEELHDAKRECDRRVLQLDMDCRSLQQRISSYESLENELEETLEEAAQNVDSTAGHDDSAAPFAGAAGPGVSVAKPPLPSLLATGHFATSRHWQNRLSVARRLLQCDRECVSLRRQLADEREAAQRFRQELDSNRVLLQQTQQPMSVLIQGMQTRDEELRNRDCIVSKLRSDLESLQTERCTLLKEKSTMMADLERLLRQQENFTQMRDTIRSLQEQRHTAGHSGKHKPRAHALASDRAQHAATEQRDRPVRRVKTRGDGDDGCRPVRTSAVVQEVIQAPPDLDELSQPEPTIFTKHVTKSRKKTRHHRSQFS